MGESGGDAEGELIEVITGTMGYLVGVETNPPLPPIGRFLHKEVLHVEH